MQTGRISRMLSSNQRIPWISGFLRYENKNLWLKQKFECTYILGLIFFNHFFSGEDQSVRVGVGNSRSRHNGYPSYQCA